MADLPCNYCNSSDAVEAYEDGDFCFSCLKKINSKRLRLHSVAGRQKTPRKIELTSIPEFWKNWLKARGINAQTIRHFDLQYDQLSQSIAYPIKIENKIVGYQLRDENKRIKTVRYAKEDEPFLFACSTYNASNVVVVEDPVSAMRIWQDAQINAVALMGTNLSSANTLFLIERYAKILVWMDGDIAGYKAAQRIVNDIRPLCKVSTIFTKEDPKDFDAGAIMRILKGGIF